MNEIKWTLGDKIYQIYQLKVQNPYGLNGVKIAKFKIPTIWMESKEAYQNPNWKFKIPTISMESKLLIQNPY